MIVFIFSSIFSFFSNSCVFSPTPPPHFSPTFPILSGFERSLLRTQDKDTTADSEEGASEWEGRAARHSSLEGSKAGL